LFYLPLDSPDAGAPEGCSINNSGLLSYIPDRFGDAGKAIHVAATGSASDFFYIACANTKIAANGTNSFTVGYWIRTSQPFPAGGDCGNYSGLCDYRNLTILASNTDNGGCRKYLTAQVSFGPSPGSFPIACTAADANTGVVSTTSVADGRWHHLLWVFD